MLTAKIEINGIPIVVIHALRIKGEEGELCEYEIFKMKEDVYRKKNKIILGYIQHHYDDGAEVLVKKMLDMYLDKKGKTVKVVPVE